MAFMISGLDYQPFASLFGMSDAQLEARNIVRRVVDERPGFPCRVSLQDAQIGETVLLVNYEHLAVASPYRASHAIYVRENATHPNLNIDEIPEVMRTRLLSIRAYDSDGMMVSADVAQGTEVEPGCYAARIDRA
jgi:hypothetical protein